MIVGKPRTTALNNRGIGTAGAPMIGHRHSNFISDHNYYRDSRNGSQDLAFGEEPTDERAEFQNNIQNSTEKIASK